MSLADQYKQLLSDLQMLLKITVEKHGIPPEHRSDKLRFLPMQEIDSPITINGRVIAFVNENLLLDDEGHEYSFHAIESSGQLSDFIIGIERLIQDLS